ncbi:uncharacterized protein BX664DRAFT_343198, partial [Halteromyces radiatus]|uniref:uncharacterized protein n=1 Tax=Halteromyces radiatus TaxID=101107 RepID=UPI00221F476B
MSSTFLRSSSSSSSSSTSTPNEQYQQFVAQQIAIQNHDLEDDSYDTFEGSYVGSYYWSALEKKRFFLALDRYGPHEPSLIQQRIGSTKSVFQVSLYLDLLATASEQHPMEQEDHTYIPFAYEMSDHWMSLEEDLAEQCMSLSDDHMIELNTRWIKERQTTRRKRRTHTSKEVFAAWDIFDRIAMDNLVSRRFKTDENGKKD